MSLGPREIARMMEEVVPFNRHLGIRAGDAREGWALLFLPLRPEHIGDPRRPAVHGGVLSALIDTAGGVAAWSALPEGETVSTVDLRVDFLEPARPEGTLSAEAQLVRKGNRVCHVRIAVTQDGLLVAEGRAVYNIHRDRVLAGGAHGRPGGE